MPGNDTYARTTRVFYEAHLKEAFSDFVVTEINPEAENIFHSVYTLDYILLYINHELREAPVTLHALKTVARDGVFLVSCAFERREQRIGAEQSIAMMLLAVLSA